MTVTRICPGHHRSFVRDVRNGRLTAGAIDVQRRAALTHARGRAERVCGGEGVIRP